MKKYTARLAENSEGGRIQALVDPDDIWLTGTVWKDIVPWWVVCLDQGKIVGCVQIIASTPLGHIEFMRVDESLTLEQRAYAMKVMTRFCEIEMYETGVSIARSCVPHSMKQWKKVLKRKKAHHIQDVSVFMLKGR